MSPGNLNPATYVKNEEDQLYDILNFSPPSMINAHSGPQGTGNNPDLNANSNFSSSTLTTPPSIPSNSAGQMNYAQDLNVPPNFDMSNLNAPTTNFGNASFPIDAKTSPSESYNREFSEFLFPENNNNPNSHSFQQSPSLQHQQQSHPNIHISDQSDQQLFQKNANVNLGSKSGLSLNTEHLYQPGSNNASNNDLLSPTNFNSYSGDTSTASNSYLNPRSPSVYSTHSLYSDVSSNPGSPFLDATSHFSNSAYSNVDPSSPLPNQYTSSNPPPPPMMNDHLSVSQHGQGQGQYRHQPQSNLPQHQSQQSQFLNTYLDSDPSNALNNFDTEIALGGSISSTNLIGMNNAQQNPHNSSLPSGKQIQPQMSQQLAPQQQYSDRFQQLQQQQTNSQQNIPFNYPGNDEYAIQVDANMINVQLNQDLNQLTENNLINYNNTLLQQHQQDPRQMNQQLQQQQHPHAVSNASQQHMVGPTKPPLYREVSISIDRAPEEVVNKTPSLFSNSSRNSSVDNSPNQAPNFHRSNSANQLNANTNENLSPLMHSNSSSNLMLNSQLSPSSAGSVVSEVSDNQSNLLLRPEEFQSIKRGRKKHHSNKVQSRSRSRSRSVSSVRSDGYDDDEATSGTESFNDDNEDDFGADDMLNDDENGNNTNFKRGSVSSREKMLELASPNQSSKRTQKHPSVYACHLCDKRFTRPYNLKSHLRTHTDERPFICNVCGKAFARQHDRKRHEDLHTGEKKFQCKGFLKDGTPYGCGRKFARADALRRHFQTEAGKECIRLLVEEDEMEKGGGRMTDPNGDTSAIGMANIMGAHANRPSFPPGPPSSGNGLAVSSDADTQSSKEFLSPTSALLASNTNSMQSIPQVAISPPD